MNTNKKQYRLYEIDSSYTNLYKKAVQKMTESKNKIFSSYKFNLGKKEVSYAIAARNTPGTKTPGSYTYTAYSSISRMLINCSSPLYIPLHSLRCISGVLIIAYGYGQGILPPLLSLPLSTRIICVVFYLSLSSFHGKILADDILAQIRYDTCSSTLYVITYLSHWT